MNIGRVFLFILVILSFSLTFADNLTCQYKVNETAMKEVNIFYFKDAQINSPILEVGDTKYYGNTNDSSTRWTYEFRTYSRYATYLNVTLSYLVDGKPVLRDIMVAPKQYEIVFGRGSGGSGPDFKSIRFNVTSPQGITVRRENISHEVEACKICLGKICLNDGASCVNSSYCGSGFCVRGYCSPTEACYNDSCNCPAGETQCIDNKTCVKISSVPIGQAPKCNLSVECNTSYLNFTSGLCQKSPEDLLEEEARNQVQTPFGTFERPAVDLNDSENTRFLTLGIAGLILLAIAFLFIKPLLKHEREDKDGPDSGRDFFEKIDPKTEGGRVASSVASNKYFVKSPENPSGKNEPKADRE